MLRCSALQCVAQGLGSFMIQSFVEKTSVAQLRRKKEFFFFSMEDERVERTEVGDDEVVIEGEEAPVALVRRSGRARSGKDVVYLEEPAGKRSKTARKKRVPGEEDRLTMIEEMLLEQQRFLASFLKAPGGGFSSSSSPSSPPTSAVQPPAIPQAVPSPVQPTVTLPQVPPSVAEGGNRSHMHMETPRIPGVQSLFPLAGPVTVYHTATLSNPTGYQHYSGAPVDLSSVKPSAYSDADLTPFKGLSVKSTTLEAALQGKFINLAEFGAGDLQSLEKWLAAFLNYMALVLAFYPMRGGGIGCLCVAYSWFCWQIQMG